jgi:ComF family protein
MLKINPTFSCNFRTQFIPFMRTSLIKKIASATLDIFYPNQCEICSVDLNLNERHICLNCSYDLPYLSSSQTQQKSLEKLFWGRANIEKVYALFNYQKGNQVQELLHLVKYHQKTKLAAHLGEQLGEEIDANDLDFIIPVPLHPKKLRKRGFNQSTLIANGIAVSTGVPVNEKWMRRVKHNPSQTTVNKYDRWENVRSIFEVSQSAKLENAHVLLVDDVLTTGATIEACVHQLLSIPGCRVSIATLAARV